MSCNNQTREETSPLSSSLAAAKAGSHHHGLLKKPPPHWDRRDIAKPHQLKCADVSSSSKRNDKLTQSFLSTAAVCMAQFPYICLAD